MGRGSFCRPSRGPTSTILTELEEASRLWRSGPRNKDEMRLAAQNMDRMVPTIWQGNRFLSRVWNEARRSSLLGFFPLLTSTDCKPNQTPHRYIHQECQRKPQDYGQIAKRRHGNGQHHFDSNKVDLMSFQRPQETTPTSGKAGVLKKGKNVLKQMFRHGAEKEVCQACVIIHLRAQMIVLSTPRRRLLRDLHKK